MVSFTCSHPCPSSIIYQVLSKTPFMFSVTLLDPEFFPTLIDPFLFLSLCPYSCEILILKWPQVFLVHYFWALMHFPPLFLILALQLSLIYRELLSLQFESFPSSELLSHSIYALEYFTLECLVLHILHVPMPPCPLIQLLFLSSSTLWHHHLSSFLTHHFLQHLYPVNRSC